MSDVIHQLSIFAFLQGLFLLLIYTISKEKRKRVNSYLLILIVLLMLGLVSKIGQQSLGLGRQLKGLSEFSILFFGPTVYLFVQSILSKRRLSIRDWPHYVPGVVYSLVVTFYYILPPYEVILERVQSEELFRVVRILVGVGLAVNITYFTLSVYTFRERKQILQREASYLINLNFVQNFLLAIGGCLIVWLTVYLLSFGDNDQLEISSREFIWLAIALIVLLLTYYQMVAASAFSFEQLRQPNKYANSKFSKHDLNKLKLELEAIMEQKKPYLNAKLLKADLADLLQINAPELARLLNERIGMNFFEYINYHRIHEFIRLANSPLVKEKTLLGLAQEAGFNSKSTFNKSFKQIMGCAPSEYLKRQ